MERLQIREISRQLAQDKHLSIGDAEHFVAEMFSTIVDGLKADKQIIINGLGTFKQTEFGNKESIIFTPDEEIAQIINAPFANFKTVEITNPEFLVEAEAVSEESSEDKQETQEKDVPAPVEQQVEALSEKVEALTERLDSNKSGKKNWVFIAIVAALIILCGGGYYAWNLKKEADEKHAQIAEQQRQDSIKIAEQKHRQDSILNIKKNIASLDLTDEQKREIVGSGKPGAPEYPCELTLEQAKQLAPNCSYKIIGTREVYTVEEGKDMTFIGQEYGLQQGHFLIQVYNAIESVKEGQKIRIPLVEKK